MWQNPKTIMKWQSEKLGPLSIVKDEDAIPWLGGKVSQLRVIGPDGKIHGKVCYRSEFNGRNDIIYITNVRTNNASRTLGIAGSLIGVIAALEKKKIALVPCGTAKKRKIYEKLGFRKSWLKVDGKRRQYTVLDKNTPLKPQGWANGPQGKNVRKFFIK